MHVDLFSEKRDTGIMSSNSQPGDGRGERATFPGARSSAVLT